MLVSRVSTAQYPTVFVDDNFDSYVDGGGLPDQAAFNAVWVPAGTAATNQAAILTHAQSSSAPNSVHVPLTGDQRRVSQPADFRRYDRPVCERSADV